MTLPAALLFTTLVAVVAIAFSPSAHKDCVRTVDRDAVARICGDCHRGGVVVHPKSDLATFRHSGEENHGRLILAVDAMYVKEVCP